MSEFTFYLFTVFGRGALLLLLLLLCERLFRLNPARLKSRIFWVFLLLLISVPFAAVTISWDRETLEAPLEVPAFVFPQPELPPEYLPPLPEESAESPVETAIVKRFEFPTSKELAALFGIVYIGVTLLLFLRRLYQGIRWQRRCVREIPAVTDERLLRLFLEARRKSGTEQLPVTLLDGSGYVDGPACCGVRTYHLLFPLQELSRWSDGEITMLLVHELEHLRRGDGRWSVFFFYLDAFYWFNPVYRTLKRGLEQTREIVCDEAVTGILKLDPAQRRNYARLLLDFHLRAGSTPLPCPGMGGTARELKQRITELTMNRPLRHKKFLFATLLLAALGVVTLIPACRNQAAAEPAPLPFSTETLSMETPPEIAAGDWQTYQMRTTELIREEKHSEALKRLEWEYDHILEYIPSLSGVRNSFLLSEWGRLGKKYPPAEAALRQRREERAEYLLAGKGRLRLPGYDMKNYIEDPGYPQGKESDRENMIRLGDTPLMWDIKAIDRELGEQEKSIEIFRFLDQNQPDFAKQCWRGIRWECVDAGVFDLVEKYQPDLSGWFHQDIELCRHDRARDKKYPEHMQNYHLNSLNRHVKLAKAMGKADLAATYEKEIEQFREEDPATASKIYDTPKEMDVPQLEKRFPEALDSFRQNRKRMGAHYSQRTFDLQLKVLSIYPARAHALKRNDLAEKYEAEIKAFREEGEKLIARYTEYGLSVRVLPTLMKVFEQSLAITRRNHEKMDWLTSMYFFNSVMRIQNQQLEQIRKHGATPEQIEQIEKEIEQLRREVEERDTERMKQAGKSSIPAEELEKLRNYLEKTREPREDRYPEALEYHKWYFQFLRKHELHGHFDYSEWVKLGELYPPAAESLRKLRDDDTARLLANQKGLVLPPENSGPEKEQQRKEFFRRMHDDFPQLRAVTAINRALGEPEKNIALFRRLAKESPDFFRYHWTMAKWECVDAKAIDLLNRFADPGKEFTRSLESARQDLGDKQYPHKTEYNLKTLPRYIEMARLLKRPDLEEKFSKAIEQFRKEAEGAGTVPQ